MLDHPETIQDSEIQSKSRKDLTDGKSSRRVRLRRRLMIFLQLWQGKILEKIRAVLPETTKDIKVLTMQKSTASGELSVVLIQRWSFKGWAKKSFKDLKRNFKIVRHQITNNQAGINILNLMFKLQIWQIPKKSILQHLEINLFKQNLKLKMCMSLKLRDFRIVKTTITRWDTRSSSHNSKWPTLRTFMSNLIVLCHLKLSLTSKIRQLMLTIRTVLQVWTLKWLWTEKVHPKRRPTTSRTISIPANQFRFMLKM